MPSAKALGLQEGYSQAQWGPWKSFALLFQEAVLELKWQENVKVLSNLFKEYPKSKEGHVSAEEFEGILKRYPCCNAVYIPVFFELFDRNQDGLLSETDFLAGAMAVSPLTPHRLDSPSGQMRTQFIFLYYDANRNGQLEVEEVAKMIEHIHQLRGQPHLNALADATALVQLYEGNFGFANFWDVVQKRMLNGTGPLLRMQQDLAECVRSRVGPPAPAPPPASSTQETPKESTRPPHLDPLASLSEPAEVPKGDSAASSVRQCRPLPSQDPSRGVAVPPATAPARSAWPTVAPATNGFTCTQAPPSTTPSTGSSQLPPGAFTPAPRPPAAMRGSQPTHEYWVGTPHTGSPQETLALRIVRQLMHLSNQGRPDWQNTLQLVNTPEMFLLCDTVVEFLREEDSLVEVQLPCRVYGDIHGQLLDLLEFFNAFSWPDKRRGDIFSMNYIFLGDFVDRGAYSCDVVSLLFSLKILYPTRVFLVRGNHEDRLMNVNYGFAADCGRKFGRDGEDVWQRVNDVFEFLPLAALVGGSIFCIHGGIGDSIFTLDDLRHIPKPIQVVAEVDSKTTRQERQILDALWSDPTDNDQILGVHVSPRGKNTCRFGPDRVQDFNRRNGLRLIIRAHECVQYGYEYFAGGELLTVFSATNYCNQHDNDGAVVVLVKDDKTGEVVEHAQVIKSGTVDTSSGWNDQQFRAPSPMRRAPAGER